jgi:hypothetical protein
MSWFEVSLEVCRAWDTAPPSRLGNSLVLHLLILKICMCCAKLLLRQNVWDLAGKLASRLVLRETMSESRTRSLEFKQAVIECAHVGTQGQTASLFYRCRANIISSVCRMQ